MCGSSAFKGETSMQIFVRFSLFLLLVSLFVSGAQAQALTVSTVAGTGLSGFSGDGGPATAAFLSGPSGVAADAAGNIYIADTANHRIRKIDVNGIITTIAGTGIPGFSGDGDSAITAQLNTPVDVAVNAAGTYIYVADQGNNRIRRIFSGFMTTAVGNGGPSDGVDGNKNIGIGPPTGVAVDNASPPTVYFSVASDHRVRKLNDVANLVTTVAGNGIAGFNGDGFGSGVQLNSPGHLALDAFANLYIADTNNFRVRKVTPGGILTTIAGNGTAGLSGDGGLAVSAGIGSPWAVAVDSQSNVYFTTTNFPTVRKISSSGFISTVAGNGTTGSSGDGGLAILAQFGTSMAMAIDSSGNIYLADALAQRIRKLLNSQSARVGGFAHIAFGGAWRTTLTLVNLSSGPIDAQIRFFGDTGNSLAVPVSFPLTGGGSSTNVATVTVPANGIAVVETASTSSITTVGWADVQASGPLSGYTIFRDTSHNSEGTVLLDNGGTSLTMAFDNRNGGTTGFALANLGGATTVSVLVLDQNGTQIGSGQVNIAASGHYSNFLDLLVSGTANRAGTVRFQTTTSTISGIGLRFGTTQSFTSVPVLK